MKDSITYTEAINLVVERLKEEKSIKRFCNEHDLCYMNVLDIKNHKDTRFPSIVEKLLKIYFDYTSVKRDIIFWIN